MCICVRFLLSYFSVFSLSVLSAFLLFLVTAFLVFKTDHEVGSKNLSFLICGHCIQVHAGKRYGSCLSLSVSEGAALVHNYCEQSYLKSAAGFMTQRHKIAELAE
jgi:hypothetical protein